MKNQNVKIDDTGIDFSSNAAIKWNGLNCVYIAGGYYNFGHMSFQNIILGSTVSVGNYGNSNYVNDFLVCSSSGMLIKRTYNGGMRITQDAVGNITMGSNTCKLTATSIGFFNKTPISQPSISSESGSSVSVSKFNQVVAALHNLGLCRDTTIH